MVRCSVLNGFLVGPSAVRRARCRVRVHHSRHFGRIVCYFELSCGNRNFPLEACKRLRVFGDVVRKEFQRDEAMKTGIFRLVNHPHTTTAKFLDDSIMRDGLPDHWADMLGAEDVEVNELDESASLLRGRRVN